MRKIILPVLMLLATSFLAQTALSQDKPKEKESQKADKIKWYSFEEAFKLSKKKPKKMLIDVYTDWCGWCKRMDADTYTNAVIQKYVNKNFYCVKLDAERKDTLVINGVTYLNQNPGRRGGTHQLAVQLLGGKMSYPSTVFMDENFKVIQIIPGYHNAKDFEPIIHYFGDDSYKKTPWEEYQKSFSGDIK
ncbi:MAG: DUF255 domain-containing protein [Bacteroidetes bacterium]|nr:DUF255 domain-containing protein [Bacteroidota bacterium]